MGGEERMGEIWEGEEEKGERRREKQRKRTEDFRVGPYFWCLRSANFLRVLLACFVAVFTSI